RTGTRCRLLEPSDEGVESRLLPTPASLGTNEIEEYAFVVVPQVRQVVGEVGEVVADADLQVLADVTIDRSQSATAALADIREVQHSHLSHAVPVLAEPPVQAQHRELRGVVEEIQL